MHPTFSSAGRIEVVANSVRKLPKTSFLRLADAPRIVAARENGFRESYSDDKQLLGAVKYFNVKS